MSSRAPWGRLASTLLVPVIVFAAGWIVLPTIDAHVLTALHMGSSTMTNLSVVALGITPALSGFVIVELVALAVPRLRPLRRGGPRERLRLRIAALALTFVIALVQAWFVFRYLQSLSASYRHLGPILDDTRPFPALVTIASLIGGTAFLLALAWLVDRYGLTNGMSVLLASAALPSVLHLVTAFRTLRLRDEIAPASIVPPFVAMAATAAATWWVLRLHKRLPLRHPTSGIWPILGAVFVLELPSQLANLGVPLGPLASVAPGTALYRLLELNLVALFCLVLSKAFYPKAGEALRPAMGISALYLIAIVGIDIVRAKANIPFSFDPLLVAVVTAVVMDVRAEWRARAQLGELVPAWPVHQVAKLDEALVALSAAGIAAHPRAANHRTLLFFFGPYVPIELLVAPDRVAEAQELLEPIFMGAADEPSDDPVPVTTIASR